MADSEVSVEALASAIANAEPHTFTPLHSQLAYQALRTRSYGVALTVLDDDIYKIAGDSPDPADGTSPTQPFFNTAPNGAAQIKYQEVVAYFLYGGMIYLTVGNYDRAIRFFELATVYPASNTASKIQVEAYKKWILVSLLHKGKVPGLVRHLGGQHHRLLQSLAKPYEAVAEAFGDPNKQKLAQTINIGKTIWAQDLNTGLIALVLRAHQRFAISSLSKIYQSIPIKKIHELAFVPSTTHNEVYEYISNLIATGQLPATLTNPGSDAANAYLRFTSGETGGADVENQRLQLAVQQQAKVNIINDYVKDMTHTLQTSKPYLQSLHKSRKKNAGGGSPNNGTANMGFMANQFSAEDDDEYLEAL